MKRFTLLGLVFCLVAFPALAQVQYGSISGSVVDNDGRPLPGVTVTLSGPTMQGNRMAVTDMAGKFRLVPVPPGENFTLAFQLASFNTLELSQVTVNVGKDTAVRAEMSLSEFAETITVTADKLVVDTTKSTVDTTVDWALMDTIATNRFFGTVMQMAPGVQDGNNPYVHGAFSDDNAYLVDGVDTTDPRTNTWGTQMNWDTIAEVQLQTGGFLAEFGRATGGVVNVVTKSGGNNFSFTGRVVKSDSDWAAKPGIEDETGRTKSAQAKREELRPNVTLGGPILRDQLWFYAAYEWRDRDTTFGRYQTLADAADGIAAQEISSYKGHFLQGKLTLQANPSHSFVAFYNEDPIDITNVNAYGYYGPGYSQSAENIQAQGGDNSSLQWLGVLSPSTFMDVKYQRTRQLLDYYPQDYSQWNHVPLYYDYDNDYYYGAPLEDYQSKRDRDGLQASGSYFLDAAGSSHQIKAGVEWLEIKPTAGSYYNTAGEYDFSDGLPYRRYFWLDQAGPQPTKDTYWGLYVQDAWRLGRLTLNLGLRAESITSENNVGATAFKFDFADQIAPRLGFAYDLNGDVIRGSLGRFYDLPSNYIPAWTSSTSDRLQRWGWNGTCAYDPGTAVTSYRDSCWDLHYDVATGESGYVVDPGLEPIYTDEITLGYEKLLSDQYAGGVNLVWRQQDEGIERIDPEDDGIYYITNVPLRTVALPDDTVVKSGNKWMEYQAVELSMKKRFGPDGFQFLANYTYVIKSKAWNGARGGQLWSGYGRNPDRFYSDWYGDQESPHSFKLNGSWTAPWRTVFGLSAFWNSGNVYTPLDPVSGYYDLVPAGETGSKRVGDNWEANVHVEQPVSVGPVDLALYVDVTNVFNNQQPTSRGSYITSSTYEKPTRWQSPRQVQIGFKIQY